MSSTPYRLLEGKKLAATIIGDISKNVDGYVQNFVRPPGLAVILVGDDPASHAYVRNKAKAAAQCGFKTFDFKLPADTSLAQIKQQITDCNLNPLVDGILVQLPLPRQLALHEAEVIRSIDPAKDADGLHPANQGLLISSQVATQPCTPLGCMKLLDLAFAPELSYETAKIPRCDLSGKSALVIGRSILVGKPVALMLLDRNATVTIAHSRTADLASLARQSDVLIAAVGKPQLVKSDWVKSGAVVIDVGINRVESAEGKGRLVGDVDFEEVAQLTQAITPVPGGVGPMTVAMLMSNTLDAYRRTQALG